MKFRLVLVIVVLLCAGYWALADSSKNGGKTEVLRGWLSDEECAKGRAQSGEYTATNPECAKKCVAKGKKIVLIDPTGKRVLVIANPQAARYNVGDYVEITGKVDPNARTIQADSIKFLEKTHLMCDVPAKKSVPEN
jgi:hypothetical protein